MSTGAVYRAVRFFFGVLLIIGGLFFVSEWIGFVAYHPPNIWAFFWIAIGLVLVNSALKSKTSPDLSPNKRFVGSGNLAALEAFISTIDLVGAISLVWLSTFLDWGVISKTSFQEALRQMPLAITFTGRNIIASSKLFFIGMALFLLVLSISGFAITRGILKNKSWKPPNALTLLAINLPLGFFFVSSDLGCLTTIFMNTAVLYYLTRPKTKIYVLLLIAIIIVFFIAFSILMPPAPSQ